MSRVRSRSYPPLTITSSLRKRLRTGVNGSWGAWNNIITPRNTTYQDSDVMTDEKTPGYFRAVREGTVIPVSPMQKASESYAATMVSSLFQSHPNSNAYAVEYEVNGMFTMPGALWATKPTRPSLDGNVALQSALSRAQNDCFDALTFAAELRKTIESIVSLRARAMKMMSHFDDKVAKSLRGNTHKIAESSKILAAIWLEMRYMWRPLIYDMFAIQEAVRRMQSEVETPLQRAYDQVTGSSSSSLIKSGNTLQMGNVSTTINEGTIRATLIASTELTLHAAVGLKVVTRDIYMLDPVVTAWELIPFSFVLDWFITIGDALAAFSPFATGRLQYASLATRETTVYQSTFMLAAASGFTGNSVAATQTRVSTAYQRVKATPSPTLAVDVNLDASKVIDLVALWLVSNSRTLTRIMRFFK